MKIKDIVGTKKRYNRDSRKRRIVQKSLFTVDPKKLSEGARIQHLEDLAIWDGSNGGKKAIASLKSLEHSPGDTTIKWDGSPAIIYGRNDQGEFVLTDKSGFGAKGYDGRVTSPEALEKMFMSRKSRPGTEASRAEFAARMASLWPAFESSTPADFRGYVHGDLLYTETPSIKNNRLVFQPNTTLYTVDPLSDIGKRVANSKIGVVLHAYIDMDGNISAVDATKFTTGELLVMPPAVVTTAPEIDVDGINELEAIVAKYGNDIDTLVSPPPELKMKSFQDMLYTYVNSAVKTNSLGSLGNSQHFMDWLSNSKASNKMKEKVVDWIKQHNQGFDALFQFIAKAMTVKNQIIKLLDSQPADIEAHTNGEQGGEGYVVGRDVKLVNRAGFTAANFARNN